MWVAWLAFDGGLWGGAGVSVCWEFVLGFVEPCVHYGEGFFFAEA